MLYILSGIILIILAIFGVVSLIGEIVLHLTCAKNSSIVTMLKISKDNENEAEYILRSAAAREKWIGKKFPSKVICVDCGMSDQTRAICFAVCKDYPFMEIKTPAEICSDFQI